MGYGLASSQVPIVRSGAFVFYRSEGGPGSVGNATYVWLPLMPGNGTFSLSWHDTWKIGDFAV